ncbi:MAG: UDP-glucose 4-epimerase GalE [Microbacteriaceae bacterium]|nr:UDP-glucose 4-epimerase GalE [Microbacteriaceae bacterium]
MAWLVTGGAGYIGSHVVRALAAAGLDTVVLDDLSTGRRDFVPTNVSFVRGSITDAELLASVFHQHSLDGVIHLAGYKYAGESVSNPLVTFHQNVTGTVILLSAMATAGVNRIVFSSSAAVYGTPTVDRVTEDTVTNPQTPYGETKLIGEWLMRDMGVATGLRHTSLRYFNVVGSGTDDVVDTSPHNLLPLVFDAVMDGRDPKIFGDDYPTLDGTCVRDYVHVSDVADAHVSAATVLMNGGPLEPVYNLGGGTGTSVREILTAVKTITGIEFEPEVRPRRNGDPARVVADGSRASRDLGWAQRHSVESMVASAWSARKARS